MRIPLYFVGISLVLVLFFKWVPVIYTPLMLRRTVQFFSDSEYHTHQRWTPLSKISLNASRAVLTTEDDKFFTHDGFAWEALNKMRYEHFKYGRPLRGCSTISQQTAKNVFTWGTHTVVRKAFEAYWTFLIEKMWGKRRILEVYLNVAEMGKGIYGVGAASRIYFGCTPAQLTATQAAAIAVSLPNPLRRSPAWAISHSGRVSRVAARLYNADVSPLIKNKPAAHKKRK